MYKNPFFITKSISNNAFSFALRKNPSIYIPSLREGSLKDVAIGEHIVFEEFNENGQCVSCRGLKNFVKICKNPMLKNHASIYIFDNHNHAFAFWHWEWQQKNIQNKSLLVHIDQHKDNRVPEKYLSESDAQSEEKVFEYTNTVLNVGNFIPPAQKTGLIDEVIMIDSEYSMENFKYEKRESDLVLDIDLDFFSPDMAYIDNQKKITFIKKLLPIAKVVTIATSPFFIEQDLAVYWLKKIILE